MDSRILKVIVAVAALHVLVLGSMFLIQHGCKKPTADSSLARPEPAPPLLPQDAPPASPPGGLQPSPPTAYVPIPAPTPAPPVDTIPSVPTTKVYTIKQGDTLGKIAQLQGVNLSDLIAANPGIDPKKLRIGQEIQIPVPGAATPGAATTSLVPTPTLERPVVSTTYTVKSGDTLGRIAKSQGTTVVALKKANKLSSDMIHVGQKLKIPPPTESGQRPPRASLPRGGGISALVDPNAMTHTVQPGETPAIIAKKHGVSTQALLAANGNLDPKRLKIGQKLVIPGKRAEPAPAEPVAPMPPQLPPPSETTNSDTGPISGAAIAPPPSTPPVETPPPAQ